MQRIHTSARIAGVTCVQQVNEHNHAPIVAEKENTLVLNSLKDRALNCPDTTQQTVEHTQDS